MRQWTPGHRRIKEVHRLASNSAITKFTCDPTGFTAHIHQVNTNSILTKTPIHLHFNRIYSTEELKANSTISGNKFRTATTEDLQHRSAQLEHPTYTARKKYTENFKPSVTVNLNDMND